MKNLLLIASALIAGSTFAEFHGQAEIANGREWRTSTLSDQFAPAVSLGYGHGAFDIKLESLSTPAEAAESGGTQLNLQTTYSGSLSSDASYKLGMTYYTYPSGNYDSWNEFNMSFAYNDFSFNYDYANKCDFQDNAEKSTHIALAYEHDFKPIDLKLTAGNFKLDTSDVAYTYYQIEGEYSLLPNLTVHVTSGQWSDDNNSSNDESYTTVGLKSTFK